MASVVEENLSKRINSLRFLLIVFVVIIHSRIRSEAFSERNITAIIPNYVENVQNLIGIITAVAVPLFFMFSSYFLYAKEQKYLPLLKKKYRTILLPYLLWHILLLGFYFMVSTLPYTRQFFSTEKSMLLWNWLDWIKAFVGDYTHKDPLDVLHIPFVAQFWFLRDLLILNILCALIKKLVDVFPLGIIVFSGILWINNIIIYIVSPEALMFFVFGYLIVKYNLTIKHIDKIKSLDLFIVYGITIMLEYCFIQQMPILHKINIIIGCIFFLKISRYFVENVKAYKVLAWLEKYEFIVYVVHTAIIPQILKIYIKIVPFNGVYILMGYFVMILFGVFLSLVFGIMLKKISPKIYGILTGGRI